MNITKFITLFTLFIVISKANQLEPRLSAEGKIYSITIYESVAVIKRNIDGEQRSVDGVSFGESPLNKKEQPHKFFDDETNHVLLLMDNNKYLSVSLDEMFDYEEGDIFHQVFDRKVSGKMMEVEQRINLAPFGIKDEPVSKVGKNYNITINESRAIIERNIDGEKKEIEGLRWGLTPMEFRPQPDDFFDDESNMAIFLMDNYQYWVVDVDALFRGEEEQLIYEIIEGGVRRPGGINRNNYYWNINGIYPNKTIRGFGSAGHEHDEGVSFTLLMSGDNAYTLETSNREASRILKLRALDYKRTTERVFRYVFK